MTAAEKTSDDEQGADAVKRAHTIIHNIENQMIATLSRDKQKLLEQLLSECFNNLNNMVLS